MDLKNILSFKSPQTDNENDYSEMCVENDMDEIYQIEQLPQLPMDSCDVFQEIESNIDIKHDLNDEDEDILDEFQDIIGDLNGMLDEYTAPLNDINYYRENYSGSVNETKALLDLDDSNVVLRESVYQDETDVVAFNNTGKIGIEYAPLSTYQAVKDDKTHESEINSPMNSLPSFQEAFKMFINTSTQENPLSYNVQHKVNTDNSKYIDNNEQNRLHIKTTNITDETDYDIADITLVEDQTETYEIMTNDIKFIDNDKAKDEFAGKLKAIITDYDSDCPGYHSSDFELISESEAEMDGLVMNDPELKSRKKNIKAKKINTVKDSEKNNSAQVYLLHKDNHSRRNETHRDEQDINDHKIPDGEDFFNLFQGNNEPILPMYYMMENKSLGATSCMAIQYRGMGFDMRMMGIRDDTDDDELKEDAKRSVNKILDMYPFENCKLKRRR